MSHQPEDLFSPEDESEIQRSAIRGKVSDDLEVIGRMVIQMRANPEAFDPEFIEGMHQMVVMYEAYMKQQGIGLPQPDVDI